MPIRDALLSWIMPDAVRMLRSAESAGMDITTAPPRIAEPAVHVTDRESLSLAGVFRAVQVITTAAAQVSLDAERRSTVIDRPHPLIRRPVLDMSRSAWVQSAVMSLIYTGNLFLLEAPGPELQVLNPHAVRIDKDVKTGRITYLHGGTRYRRDQVRHATFLPPLPGELYGLGPIQAAQNGMRAQRDASGLMAAWHHDTGQPRGILKSKQRLTSEQAMGLRRAWNGLDAEGNPVPQSANPTGIKVLDSETDYQQVLLSPKDALWLESQSWTTRDLAMLFGIPPTLMLISLEGGSQTYSNVEQDWLGFIRFTLAGFLRPIEEAISDALPNGQVARFNYEALLRADTTTRYEAHASALAAGWMTVDEVRAVEGLPPLTEVTAETTEDTHA